VPDLLGLNLRNLPARGWFVRGVGAVGNEAVRNCVAGQFEHHRAAIEPPETASPARLQRHKSRRFFGPRLKVKLPRNESGGIRAIGGRVGRLKVKLPRNESGGICGMCVRVGRLKVNLPRNESGGICGMCVRVGRLKVNLPRNESGGICGMGARVGRSKAKYFATLTGCDCLRRM